MRYRILTITALFVCIPVGILLGLNQNLISNSGILDGTLKTSTNKEKTAEDYIKVAEELISNGGQFKDIQSAANQSLAIKETAWGYFYRGLVNSTLRNNKDAISDFTKAIELDPELLGAYKNRQILQSRIGNYYEAHQDYNRSKEIRPNFYKVLYNRGMNNFRLGNFHAAINDYTQVIDNDPNDYWALHSRGIAKSSLGLFQEAINDYMKALKINPSSEKILTSIGVDKSRLGSNQEAIDYYTQALAINPSYELAYFNRARVRHDLEDISGACEDWMKVSQSRYPSLTKLIKDHCELGSKND